MSDGVKKMLIIAVVAVIGGFMWKSIFQENDDTSEKIKVDKVSEVQLRSDLKAQDKRIGELLAENSKLKQSQLEKESEKSSKVEEREDNKETDQLIIHFFDKLFNYDASEGQSRLIGLENYASTKLLNEIEKDAAGEEDYHTHTEDQASLITVDSLKIYRYDKEDYIITYNTFFEFESGAKTSLECVASIKLGDNVVTEWDQFVTNVIK